ncbi:MAG: hypothetical protein HC896_02880 [Bacteroidales bacterium]|nr:hypothetical protein [Bacteroidales bacterium]
MNESVLEALMRLFAIVADVNKEGQSGNERDIIQAFLQRQYNQELVNKYLHLFDQDLLKYHPDLMFDNADEAHKQNSKNETRLVEICDRINEELEHQQKIITLIYLLDFINRGESLTGKELRFVTTVAHNLKINKDEFNDLKCFTFGQLNTLVHPGRLLFINHDDKPLHAENKHFPVKNFEGSIAVLHVASSNTLVFRYQGNLDLFLNGLNVKPHRSYIWSVGSIIKNQRFGSIYYSKIVGQFIQAQVKSKFVF